MKYGPRADPARLLRWFDHVPGPDAAPGPATRTPVHPEKTRTTHALPRIIKYLRERCALTKNKKGDRTWAPIIIKTSGRRNAMGSWFQWYYLLPVFGPRFAFANGIANWHMCSCRWTNRRFQHAKRYFATTNIQYHIKNINGTKLFDSPSGEEKSKCRCGGSPNILILDVLVYQIPSHLRNSLKASISRLIFFWKKRFF